MSVSIAIGSRSGGAKMGFRHVEVLGPLEGWSDGRTDTVFGGWVWRLWVGTGEDFGVLEQDWTWVAGPPPRVILPPHFPPPQVVRIPLILPCDPPVLPVPPPLVEEDPEPVAVAKRRPKRSERGVIDLDGPPPWRRKHQ